MEVLIHRASNYPDLLLKMPDIAWFEKITVFCLNLSSRDAQLRNVLRNADGLFASCFCKAVKRPYYFIP